MDRLSQVMVRPTLWPGSLIFLVASSASAADFVVTRYDDPQPNGCLATDCSLREAVIAAGGSSNRVVLSAGTYQLSIVDTGGTGSNSGGFRVNGTMEIAGFGADLTHIDGAGMSETILIGEGGQLNLTVRGIRFQNSDEHGVMFLDGAALIEDCAFVDKGGTIFLGGGLVGNNAMESLVLRRGTISGNTGDGLSVGAASVTIENITSTENGLLELRITSSVVSCNHCTLARDTGTGDVVRVDFTTATFSNSIVAGSCVFGIDGAIESAGGNVESVGNSCQFDQASDLAGVASEDLALGDLAANGGPTQTIAPAAGSVALGAALDALCAAEDQRGVIREVDCESGAFEVTDAAVPPRLFVDGFDQGNPGAWSQVSPWLEGDGPGDTVHDPGRGPRGAGRRDPSAHRRCQPESPGRPELLRESPGTAAGRPRAIPGRDSSPPDERNWCVGRSRATRSRTLKEKIGLSCGFGSVTA